MSAGEYCTRDVVVVEKTESVQTAVDLMRSHHVGDVVVVEKRDDRSKPVGILTDRDIVLEILAEHVDLASVNIGDVMSSELHTVREDTKFIDAIKVMRKNGIRRLPVVNGRGDLVGILTVDDVLSLLLEQLSDIVGLVVKQQVKENSLRS